MRNLTLAAFLLAAGTCFAQPPEAYKFYKLDFVVKEVEGPKVLNSRMFSTVLQAEIPGAGSPQGSIRTASKVPVSGNYYDVGVNIDVSRLREIHGDVGLSVSAEISSTATDQAGMPDRPVIRQNKWSSYVLVPVKKPTVIFASDDATSKRQMQLELTAAPVK